MKKFPFIVICVFVSFCTAVHGDTITLKNISKDIDVKVIGVTGENINVVILKKDVKSINIKFESSGDYPDLVFLHVANEAVECKIKEIADDTVNVLIPTSAISSLQMSFQSNGKQGKTVPIDVGNKQKTATGLIAKEEETEQKQELKPESMVREDIGEDVKLDEIRTDTTEKAHTGKYYRLKAKKTKMENLEEKEVLSGVRTESTPVNTGEPVVVEKLQEGGGETFGMDQKPVKDLDKAITEASEESLEKEKPDAIQEQNLGRVEGKILQSGKPLADCQVKLQMLEKGGLLAKGYRPVEGAIEIETVTDKDGVYQFMNVSPGLYKLYWKAPSETTWIRRFKMEPDVIVEAGKLTNPKAIETLKRTLN